MVTLKTLSLIVSRHGIEAGARHCKKAGLSVEAASYLLTVRLPKYKEERKFDKRFCRV